MNEQSSQNVFTTVVSLLAFDVSNFSLSRIEYAKFHEAIFLSIPNLIFARKEVEKFCF